VTLWQRFVEVNRPGPPEHSISFRAASVAAVLVGIGACWSEAEAELSATVSVVAIVATVVGNIVSYRRRANPWPGVKPILAVAAVGGFVWFILTVTRTATPGDIATVEGPLAVLFAWVLSTHAFDVPSRRDVTYSLAGSTALVAVAAAQSVDLALGAWVLAWVGCGIWGLVAMWQSLSETQGVPWRPVIAAGVLVAVAAVLLVGVLPAPKVSTTLAFTSSSPDSEPVTTPSNLTDGNGALPAHAATASGRTGVGGFLGFAKSLDTADRIALGNQVIMRVRATRPNYWIGQTFDTWNGRDWIQAANPVNGHRLQRITGGSPFTIPLLPDQVAELATGTEDVQTFYLADGGPNLVFHADNAQRVYLQTRAINVTLDGTIASTTSMGPGTIYTVVSSDTTATPAQLRAATAPGASGSAVIRAAFTAEKSRYLQLPHPDARVTALATSITSGVDGGPVSTPTTTPTTAQPGAPVTSGAGTLDPHTYDKVMAIGNWMATHVRYTTDIPPLPAGADAVDSFLFGTRRGYCEQISTATVVMLRSLGIPAREAVGYVPGPYNPITDLYDIQAKDAHAWVQVWFPGYGWQNFDPTADVPLANPAPGSVLARSIGHTLGRLPWLPISAVLAVVGVVVWVRRRRANRPATWTRQVAADLDRCGARLGLPRRIDETLSDFGRRLATAAPDHARGLLDVTTSVERATYGGIEPSAEQIAATLATSRLLRAVPKRRGRGATSGGGPGRGGAEGGPDRSGDGVQARAWASASSKDAPAASSGR
jgi:transglutaminase-like putative cysteine protease